MLKISEAVSYSFERFNSIIDTFHDSIADTMCKEV